MRNFAVITLTLCVAALMIQTSGALADRIPNQRGLEFRAGFSHYFMDDPRNDVESYQTATTTPGAPMLGLSLLYKTHPNFGWNIGYNYIMSSSLKGESSTGTVEYKLRGHELFAMGCYYMRFWTDWSLQFGLGVNGFMGSTDRDQVSGGYRDASGRSLGFLANIALEVPLKEHLGLKLGAGYRRALIDEIAYRDASDQQHTVFYGNRPLELDFSGFYGQLGLAVYFQPATHFKTYED